MDSPTRKRSGMAGAYPASTALSRNSSTPEPLSLRRLSYLPSDLARRRWRARALQLGKLEKYCWASSSSATVPFYPGRPAQRSLRFQLGLSIYIASAKGPTKSSASSVST